MSDIKRMSALAIELGEIELQLIDLGKMAKLLSDGKYDRTVLGVTIDKPENRQQANEQQDEYEMKFIDTPAGKMQTMVPKKKEEILEENVIVIGDEILALKVCSVMLNHLTNRKSEIISEMSRIKIEQS